MDFQIIVVDWEKKKKMLVGYHHLKLVIVLVAAGFEIYLDHHFAYLELEVYNIQPRRRRRSTSKLHTDRVNKNCQLHPPDSYRLLRICCKL